MWNKACWKSQVALWTDKSFMGHILTKPVPLPPPPVVNCQLISGGHYGSLQQQQQHQTQEMDTPTIQPKFLSRGNLYKVTTGDSVTLPCRVSNLGSFVLLWRRGNSVLTAGALKITRDKRFSLVDSYDLQISDVKTQDAGDYICQIGDQETRDQVHTLEILVPPTIRAIPVNGQVTARKGSTVTLECKASGNPVPSIYWFKKVSVRALHHPLATVLKVNLFCFCFNSLRIHCPGPHTSRTVLLWC